MSVGLNSCSFGAYDYIKNSKNYTCALEYYYLYDLIDHAFGGEKFGNYLINSCGKTRPSWIKVDEPGGPKPMSDMDWNDIEVIVTPNTQEVPEPETGNNEVFF